MLKGKRLVFIKKFMFIFQLKTMAGKQFFLNPFYEKKV